MVLATLSFFLVLSMLLGLAQAAGPFYKPEPVRVKKEECAAVLKPPTNPTSCACNVLRGVPLDAIFTYPPTEGIHVDWDRLKASVHYWKCFPPGVTLPLVDYEDATEPSDSSEGDDDDY